MLVVADNVRAAEHSSLGTSSHLGYHTFAMVHPEIQALKSINVFLQWFAPVVILIAAALSVRGETWNRSRKRPTRVGWCMLLLALCTMAITISSSVLSNKLKDIDGQDEEQHYNMLLTAQTQAADAARKQADKATENEKRAKADLEFLKQKIQNSLTIQHEQLSAVQRTLAVSEQSYLVQFLVSQIELRFAGASAEDVAVLHNVVGNELKLQITPSDSVDLITTESKPGASIWVGEKQVRIIEGAKIHDFSHIVGNLAFGISMRLDTLGEEARDLYIGHGLEVDGFSQKGSEMSIVYRPQIAISARAFHHMSAQLSLYSFKKAPNQLRLVARGLSFEVDTKWITPTWKRTRDTFQTDIGPMEAIFSGGPELPVNNAGPRVIIPAKK